MKKKVKILISGGSSGIGLYLIKKLLEDDYYIINLSRKKPSIKNINLLNIRCDLSHLKNIKKIENKIKKHDIKIIINCAADLGEVGYLNNINIKKWASSFNLNLFSHVYLFQIFSKILIRNKGIAIFFSGGGSANAFPKFSSYSLAKTAIVRLVENIQAEFKSVSAYCIAPGANNTRIYKNSEKYGHKVPKKKMVTPDFTYQLCKYLIKNKPSHLKGKFIHVKDDYKNKKLFSGENFFLRRKEIR
tara:strand:- start:47 stop:781 length:735 start_codon:yes stop_codon:yes gene_type:complete